MSGNKVCVNCMKSEGNLGRTEAREFLLIPLSKRIYIVFPDDMKVKKTVSVCERILKKETGDFAVYVFCSRESGTGDVIREHFGENSPVKPVIVGNKAEMYLRAADVILARISGFTDSVAPNFEIFSKEKLQIAYAKSFRTAKSAIDAARKYLDTEKKD